MRIFNKHLVLKLFLFFSISSFFIVGCNSPQLEKISIDQWYEMTTKNSLNSDELSFRARQFLIKNNLHKEYKKDPLKVIKTVSDEVYKDIDGVHSETKRKGLGLLIDLCTYTAKHSSDGEAIKYWMSSCVYSYHYFNDTSLNPTLTSYYQAGKEDIINYYNRSLSEVFNYLQRKELLNSKTVTIPTVDGSVTISGPESDIPYPLNDFEKFIVCYEYLPENLNLISDNFGVGVPLVGVTNDKKSFINFGKGLNIIRLNYPMTYFLKFKLNANMDSRNYVATQYYFGFYQDEYVTINKSRIPIAKNFSVPLTSFLELYSHKSKIDYLVRPDNIGKYRGIYMLNPYDPNKIPVLLVHGLISDPQSLYQIINTLMLNREVRENYQFMFYFYATGQPVLLSAAHLRDKLEALQKQVSAGGNSKNFDNMIVIGYSLGGLVSNLLTLDSNEDEIFKDVVAKHKTLDQKDLDEVKNELKLNREKLKGVLIFDPLPFIKKVIFIATPHQGAEMAEWMFTKFANSLISSPYEIVNNYYKTSRIASILSDTDQSAVVDPSLTNLQPGSNFVKLVAKLQRNKNVEYHSIIASRDKTSEGSTDGVVEYWSSHLPYAKSEYIVESDHHAINKPGTSAELIRIFHNYLEKLKAKEGRPIEQGTDIDLN